MEFDLKTVFGIVAVIINLFAFYPYLRDIFLKKTQPHIYTWLVWMITQGIAVAGLWYGGGSWGAVNLSIGLLLVLAVFILSFRYGTRNITKFDTATLLAALAAAAIWFLLNDPILAVLTATAIDLVGYIPTWRKSYQEPWSETINTWLLFVAANIASIFALSEYNLLTLSYITAIIFANLAVAAVCIVRRGTIPRPESHFTLPAA